MTSTDKPKPPRKPWTRKLKIRLPKSNAKGKSTPL